MIIDAYSHFGVKKDMPEVMEDRSFLDAIPDVGIEDCAKKWNEVLDKQGVEKVIFLGVQHGSKVFMDYVNGSDRFIGATTCNPLRDDYYDVFMHDIEKGAKGLALYPVWHGFDVAHERMNKLYKYCSDNGLPVVFHFGVSAILGDLRYGNPIDLSPIVKKYPELKVIIAHFGAGYFKEALMLMYKNKNVYFDTSGTNNWLDYTPYSYDLKEVFRNSLKAVGSKRII